MEIDGKTVLSIKSMLLMIWILMKDNPTPMAPPINVRIRFSTINWYTKVRKTPRTPCERLSQNCGP